MPLIEKTNWDLRFSGSLFIISAHQKGFFPISFVKRKVTTVDNRVGWSQSAILISHFCTIHNQANGLNCFPMERGKTCMNHSFMCLMQMKMTRSRKMHPKRQPYQMFCFSMIIFHVWNVFTKLQKKLSRFVVILQELKFYFAECRLKRF